MGCSGKSIRNEEAIHIMYLVCKQLKIDRQKIFENLIKIISKVISMDVIGANANGLMEKQELMEGIKKAVDELISGIEYEDEFYTQLLDKMVVNDRENIDVYLNLLPFKWSYTIAKSVNP